MSNPTTTTTNTNNDKDFVSFFTSKNRSEWSNPKLWCQLCPSLTITENKGEKEENKDKEKCTVESSSQHIRDCIINDGYALLNNKKKKKDENNNNQNLVKTLASSITTLHQKNSIPATFILLFDETWTLAQNASTTLSSYTHSKNQFNYDILAWYIDPNENIKGFSPHRDRQPDIENINESEKGIEKSEIVKQSFHEDGQAKYVTMWMALTDATPENSCLYVIPKEYDPGYTIGDEKDNEEDDADEYKDPLARALPTKESYQNIRALPRSTGQSVLFTHRILHWGSRGNAKSSIKDITPPRIAISFVSSDPSFERPYLSFSSKQDDDEQCETKQQTLLAAPPFHIRLLLVCAQLLIYHERFNLSRECIRACYDYCKQHQNHLDETYKHKVFVEFVKAMKEKEVGSSESEKKEKEGAMNDEKINGSSSCNSGVKSTEKKEKNGSGEKETRTTTTKHLALTLEINKKISKNANNGNMKVNVEADDKDDDEDAMLEEMLNAEEGGYGDFHDDYDDLEGVEDDNDDDDDKKKKGSEKGKKDENKKQEDDDDDDDDEEEAIEDGEESVELPFRKGKDGDDIDDDNNNTNKEKENENGKDDEDAMLEEMLDAEKGAYGDFHDDYDDLEENDDDDDDGVRDDDNDALKENGKEKAAGDSKKRKHDDGAENKTEEDGSAEAQPKKKKL